MSEELKWYVVRAISGKEKKVKQYLEAEINRLNATHLVTQVLIPTEKVFQIRDGKKVIKERSYFPGYVLIEANLNGELGHVIKNITGVIIHLMAHLDCWYWFISTIVIETFTRFSTKPSSLYIFYE